GWSSGHPWRMPSNCSGRCRLRSRIARLASWPRSGCTWTRTTSPDTSCLPPAARLPGRPSSSVDLAGCPTNQEIAVSLRPIRLFGDPILRTAADPVVDFDKELRQLVTDLTDTMLGAPGSGLAAPQIGVGLRVFTYNVEGVVGHLVNPVL